MGRKRCRGGRCARRFSPSRPSRRSLPVQPVNQSPGLGALQNINQQPQFDENEFNRMIQGLSPQERQMLFQELQGFDPEGPSITPLSEQFPRLRKTPRLRKIAQWFAGNVRGLLTGQKDVPLGKGALRAGYGDLLKNKIGPALLGKEGGAAQLASFSPQLQGALEQLALETIPHVRPGQLDFTPIRQEAQRRFSEEVVPSLAERFAGMDAVRSSAFPRTLGSAAAGLESQLAAQEQQFKLQQQPLLQGLLSLPRQEPAYIQSTPGLLGQGLGLLAQRFI